MADKKHALVTGAIGGIRETYEVNVFGPISVTQAFLPLLKAAPAARIVMLSSSVGSLNIMSDKSHPFYAINELGYCSSKTALNAVVLAFAKELEGTPVKVNTADPGYTATDLNGHTMPSTVEQAAEIAFRLATLPPEGPTAGYFNEDGLLPW
ncbi:SDR family NAD(P)-dependent oxidoreductase [Rahnella sp. PCH160]|uniref:SDR family NAD(P)-dependent oxidoreductase n=1 Tax=Rahnella sp. PCH160 TaxID=3447928 RepID=UPI0039FBB77C